MRGTTVGVPGFRDSGVPMFRKAVISAEQMGKWYGYVRYEGTSTSPEGGSRHLLFLGAY